MAKLDKATITNCYFVSPNDSNLACSTAATSMHRSTYDVRKKLFSFHSQTLAR